MKTYPVIFVNYNTTVNISIMYYINIYTGNGCIVTKSSTFPPATPITVAKVTIPIVYTTVKPNMRAPVPGMKYINAAGEIPIVRRPKKPYLRCKHPHAWYPIVAVIAVSPVARCPNIPFPRA
jgi:hypothetical protein